MVRDEMPVAVVMPVIVRFERNGGVNETTDPEALTMCRH